MEPSDLLALAQDATLTQGLEWNAALHVLVEYGAQSPDWAAFARQGQRRLTPDTSVQDAAAYFTLFTRSYWTARQESLVLKPVSTVADPAVDVILSAFAGLTDPGTLHQAQSLHRQSMAAENLLGALLERYLAQELEPHGWVWCAGNTIRAVDFIRADLQMALQIKNRSNSENSSSVAIRTGTTIQKWYRVHAGNGRTNWHNFPAQLIQPLSEEGFHAFIRQYAHAVK